IGSMEWSNGSFEQARGRVDRVNSRVPANIYVVLHKNTIEERVFDVVATKDDAAKICLRGERVPRDFKPADIGELIAQSVMSRDYERSGSTLVDECETEKQWPALMQAIRKALAA